MVSNVLGLLIGAEIDRDEGGEGIAGALEGYLIEGAVKAIAPLVVTFAIGWGVQFLARRAFNAVTGDSMRGPRTP
jgi:hypothetical protein